MTMYTRLSAFYNVIDSGWQWEWEWEWYGMGQYESCPYTLLPRQNNWRLRANWWALLDADRLDKLIVSRWSVGNTPSSWVLPVF